LSDAAREKDTRIEELERQLKGLRSRLEKLGGEVVRADYKILHLTQEVRRSREAFEFLTGFQNDISRARTLEVLHRIALKSIISELWMKRAVVLESTSSGRILRPVEWLGYPPDTRPGEIEILPDGRDAWTRPHVVSGETAPRAWIRAVRDSLAMPFFVWIPETRNGRIERALVAGTLVEDAAQEPRLTGHDLDLFVSVGAILAVGRTNLLARSRLKRQVIYQSLLHRASSVLLKDYDAPTAHFDDVIAQVGNTWSLDRVRLLRRRTDERLSETSHEWTAPGVARSQDERYPLECVDRWRSALVGGETIWVDDVDALGEDAGALREAGIRSLLVVPTVVHQSIDGWVSFERTSQTEPWSPEDVQFLEVIAGLVSRAVARQREIEERVQLEAEYHHSKKMEAVGQLAGGVAHDFNNLITTIQGYAQLVISRLPGEYRDMTGLKEIIQASEKAAGLTRQLLTFSRRDTATGGEFDLDATIRDTMRLIDRMLGDKVDVVLDLSDGLPTIVGDPQQLSQVVMNLAINARDAMPEGGELRFATRRVTVTEALSRRISIPGIRKCQLVEVTDTGNGMDEETQERIFEPFFTTKEEGKGTGLGLAIAFSVVRRHGGFIDVVSSLGKGTTFRIYLPERSPGPSGTAEATQEKRITEKILVVEDDEGVRTMIADALTAQGYEILSATNGREALSELDRVGDGVSLVVTDVVMPEMGGRQMWERITEQGYDVPVIVMSGYPNGKDATELTSSAATFLQKPFGPREIARAVRHALDASRTAPGDAEASPDPQTTPDGQ
jgi:signal transduction histidine kinase/CheY-like chemotaxis protein